jgi:hypothetical protein
MTAMLWPLLGLVYVSGAFLIAFFGVLEARNIAAEEPHRPHVLAFLAWLGAAITWPAIVVLGAAVVLFGDL